jgi:hypothetical protein
MSLVLLFAFCLSDLGVLGLAENLSLVTPFHLLAFVLSAECIDLGVASALLLKQLTLMVIAHL